MFDLPRFVCELVLGSSSSLSRDSFDFLSSNLHALTSQIIQQAFSIALRSKRTRLLGDDLQLALKCRAVSPLFGYCCSSSIDAVPSYQNVRRGSRILFVKPDIEINLKTINNYHRSSKNEVKTKIIPCGDIFLHVEWLALAGEQKHPNPKIPLLEKSMLRAEQRLYLSFLQSKNYNKQKLNFLSHDQVALETILPHLTKWCQNNVLECLAYICRPQKRRELCHYLIMIDCLLDNPSTTIDRYLHIWLSMIVTCLLNKFEVDESFNIDNEKFPIDTGHVWTLRQVAARICAKVLQRCNILVYNILHLRVLSRLVCSLIDSNSSSSVIYAILYVFEQLGEHVCRTFLLTQLEKIDQAKIHSSQAIMAILERITRMILDV